MCPVTRDTKGVTDSHVDYQLKHHLNSITGPVVDLVRSPRPPSSSPQESPGSRWMWPRSQTLRPSWLRTRKCTERIFNYHSRHQGHTPTQESWEPSITPYPLPSSLPPRWVTLGSLRTTTTTFDTTQPTRSEVRVSVDIVPSFVTGLTRILSKQSE